MNKLSSRFAYIAFLTAALIIWVGLGYFEAIEAPYVNF